ncbi:hypothetical protein L596_012042 [Steinernema carpocapsae]|uniref:PAP-associated domain-containing protein n=1 Tax=Steinernema carpocapsae TaxID=34508 RepID=A0A4U5NWI5_STECR|nr:hypothetical protein L596_012042 [Steinernema carpocapsae]
MSGKGETWRALSEITCQVSIFIILKVLTGCERLLLYKNAFIGRACVLPHLSPPSVPGCFDERPPASGGLANFQPHLALRSRSTRSSINTRRWSRISPAGSSNFPTNKRRNLLRYVANGRRRHTGEAPVLLHGEEVLPGDRGISDERPRELERRLRRRRRPVFVHGTTRYKAFQGQHNVKPFIFQVFLLFLNLFTVRPRKVLTGARDILKTSSLQYKTLVLLPSARFPILKVQLFRKNKKALVVDLMIDSMPNLRNSLFVQNASRSVDPRVHQLHLWVKQWLQVCGLVGSIQGLFSTYHTALLVIHFLQYIDHPDMKPVLPLMLDHFPRDLSPDTPFSDIYTLGTSPASFDPSSLESPNKMSIGDLIVRFVDFYNRTELSEFELNIPTGKNVRRKDDEFQRIMMIDPYDSRSVCAVEQGVGRLSEACQQTYEMFSAGRGFQVPFSFIRR